MNRYLILLAAVVMQMCLGATYSWSVYVQPIRTLTGLLQGPVQMPFTVFYFAFPAVMMLAGTLLPRLGTRRSAMLGGLLFGGGWIVAGLGHSQFALVVLGIGLLAGIGAGFAYIVPIAVCIQWFPRHKGLVTGIAVAGFGGGAALVSQAGAALMTAGGLTPFETFSIFGGVFLVLVTGAGCFMSAPVGARPSPVRSYRPKAILSRSDFRILYLAMFTGLAAGFTVNANLKELYTGLPAEAGVAAVAVFAVANAAGRIGWGMLFDRISSAAAIQANLAFQALVLAGASWMIDGPAGLWTVAALSGFNYGGVLVIYVSATARRWGNQSVGRIYGWLFSANIPAALSPMLAGVAFDRFGSFALPLQALAVMLLISVVMVHRSAVELNDDQAVTMA